MPFRLGWGFGLILVVACSRTPSQQQLAGSKPSARSAPAGSRSTPLAAAQFHLAEATSSDSSRRYLAHTDDPSRTCSFEILLAPPSATEGAPFSIGKASLRRVAGSDCAEFLRRVAKQIGFRGSLPRPGLADELPCSIAVLGTAESRFDDPEVGPSFATNPPGNWTTGKLFLADGEGEVYLNLNEHDGLGEFSLKDTEYSTIVVTELARILLPRAG